MKTISKGKYLIDTNILVYGLDKNSPYHSAAVNILQTGIQPEYKFVIAQQNLIELISVLTKVYKVPKTKAVKDAYMYAYNFELINPLSSTFSIFAKLIKKKNVKAHPFDVYLVATMKTNEVHRIITADKQHFAGCGLKQIVSL